MLVREHTDDSLDASLASEPREGVVRGSEVTETTTPMSASGEVPVVATESFQKVVVTDLAMVQGSLYGSWMRIKRVRDVVQGERTPAAELQRPAGKGRQRGKDASGQEPMIYCSSMVELLRALQKWAGRWRLLSDVNLVRATLSWGSRVYGSRASPRQINHYA